MERCVAHGLAMVPLICALAGPVWGTAQDTIPPTVIGTNPPDGATDVPQTIQSISVRFSELMETESYPGNIFVTEGTDLSGPRVAAGGTGYGETAWILIPADLLAPETLYAIHVLTGVTDLFGNHLVEPVLSTFTTGVPVETRPMTWSALKAIYR